jgi:hypothetical protein
MYWTIGLRIPAPVARLDAPPKGRRSAARQVGQGPALFREEAIAARVEEGVTMSSDDIGDFDPLPGHGRCLRSKRPSGLGPSRR